MKVTDPTREHVVLADLRPVEQRPHGCWAACIATLTGISLDDLPHPTDDELTDTAEGWERYYLRVRVVLQDRGWAIVKLGQRVPLGFAIASGISPRSLTHAVVTLDGNLWHDPHPSRAGLETLHDFEILVRIQVR